MANQKELLSRFYRGEDIPENKCVHLTIKSVTEEEVGAKKELKWIIAFNETEKRLVMGKCHRLVLIATYGDFDEQWVGKPVTLISELTKSPAGIVRGVRILMKGGSRLAGLPPEAEAHMYGA